MISPHMRKIICLTPIKDEAWILEHFIKSAESWADVIIIADQNSTDGSREIALKSDKVHLIENRSDTFNEPERQKLLLEAAREFGGNNILISLDADEAFSSDATASKEWKTMLDAPTGTNFCFRWVNLCPDVECCWSPKAHHVWGFVDDGRPHIGNAIHSPRVPLSETKIFFEQIRVLHFQYVDWARMQSKQRWYMAWEYLNKTTESTTQLHRTYSHMYMIRNSDIQQISPSWLTPDQRKFFNELKGPELYRWDFLMKELIEEHGLSEFARIPVWEENRADYISGETTAWKITSDFRDPRSIRQKFLQRWLRFTTKRHFKLLNFLVDPILKKLGA